MFLVAAKTAMVEALRATFISQFPDIMPQRVDVEYPEDQEDWPACLVQFRPTGPVTWTGLYPDMHVVIDNSPNPDTWKQIREGNFTGNVDLTVLALSSGERDRLWDALVQMILMGDETAPTTNFFTTLDTHDLINMTIQKSLITPIGDSIAPGTPWDPDVLSYEATIRFVLQGQFYANIYTEELISISSVQVLEPYRPDEPAPDMNDGLGPWKSVPYFAP